MSITSTSSLLSLSDIACSPVEPPRSAQSHHSKDSKGQDLQHGTTERRNTPAGEILRANIPIYAVASNTWGDVEIRLEELTTNKSENIIILTEDYLLTLQDRMTEMQRYLS
jgi:hypothetical protein